LNGVPPGPDLLAQIYERRYGAALIPTEKPEGYRLARRAHIPIRVGFENGWGKPLKTLWIRRMCTRTIFRTAGLDPRAPHECEVVFKLVQAITTSPEPPRDPNILRPYVIDEEPQRDDRIAFQVTDKWHRLGAHMDAVVQLARRIGEHQAVRYIASEQESRYVRAFSDAAGVAVETFARLAPWKTAIAAARAVVAPDSGAAHVAGMVGTPVVSCFAQQDFALQSKRWAPWAAPHQVVRMESAWPLVAADALQDLLQR
jgi:ADP-heptose:LPS heptosyltransferase